MNRSAVPKAHGSAVGSQVSEVALRAVHIRAADVASATTAFETIVGSHAVQRNAESQLGVGDAALRLSALPQVGADDDGPEPRRGIWALDIVLPHAQAAVVGASVDIHGMRVFVSAPGPAGRPVEARVKLDHVALMVHDIDQATLAWERLTGLAAHRLAVHPVSRGTLAASRFLLGPRMIELLAPLPSKASPLATRLAQLGEGPLAMALVAADLEATLARLRAAGVGLVYNDPHWVVRPGDASGVPIQLTPRVEH